jgi:hypothetical protein
MTGRHRELFMIGKNTNSREQESIVMEAKALKEGQGLST